MGGKVRGVMEEKIAERERKAVVKGAGGGNVDLDTESQK